MFRIPINNRLTLVPHFVTDQYSSDKLGPKIDIIKICIKV